LNCGLEITHLFGKGLQIPRSGDIDMLDANQQAILEFIAYQNPYSGGDAVYSARVMLGLDIADFIENSNERKANLAQRFTVYDRGVMVPNPNSGKMSYIYSMDSNSSAELQIFSSQGVLIRKIDIPSDNHSIDIDLTDQVSGIYVYRVVTDGTIYAGNKIILQR
jgi:hypothetical protein